MVCLILYLCQECRYQLHHHLLLGYIVHHKRLILGPICLNAMVHLFELELHMSPLLKTLHHLEVLPIASKSVACRHTPETAHTIIRVLK